MTSRCGIIACSVLCEVSVRDCMILISFAMVPMCSAMACIWGTICGVTVSIMTRPFTRSPSFSLTWSTLSIVSLSDRMAQHIGMSKQCFSQ